MEKETADGKKLRKGEMTTRRNVQFKMKGAESGNNTDHGIDGDFFPSLSGCSMVLIGHVSFYYTLLLVWVVVPIVRKPMASPIDLQPFHIQQ